MDVFLYLQCWITYLTAKKIDFHWLRKVRRKMHHWSPSEQGYGFQFLKRRGLIVTTKGLGVIFLETSEIKQYVILINAKIESTNVDFGGKGKRTSSITYLHKWQIWTIHRTIYCDAVLSRDFTDDVALSERNDNFRHKWYKSFSFQLTTNDLGRVIWFIAQDTKRVECLLIKWNPIEHFR